MSHPQNLSGANVTSRSRYHGSAVITIRYQNLDDADVTSRFRRPEAKQNSILVCSLSKPKLELPETSYLRLRSLSQAQPASGAPTKPVIGVDSVALKDMKRFGGHLDLLDLAREVEESRCRGSRNHHTIPASLPDVLDEPLGHLERREVVPGVAGVEADVEVSRDEIRTDFVFAHEHGEKFHAISRDENEGLKREMVRDAYRKGDSLPTHNLTRCSQIE